MRDPTDNVQRIYLYWRTGWNGFRFKRRSIDSQSTKGPCQRCTTQCNNGMVHSRRDTRLQDAIGRRLTNNFMKFILLGRDRLQVVAEPEVEPMLSDRLRSGDKEQQDLLRAGADSGEATSGQLSVS